MPNKIRHLLRFWLPPLVWALIIFKLSSNSLPNVTGSYWGDFTFKKLSHVFFYAVFSILLYRAFVSEGVSKTKSALFAVLFAFLYGISDEIHQSFVPGREPNIRDLGFDTIGAALGVWIKKYL